MALAGLRATAPHSSCLAQAHQPPRCAVLAIDSRWNAASRPAGRRRAPPAAAAAGGGGSSSSCDGRKAPDPAAAAAASPAASDAAVTPAAACAVSIRLARAADLPALIQLEALTMEGASWSERQIEVRCFACAACLSFRQHTCAAVDVLHIMKRSADHPARIPTPPPAGGADAGAGHGAAGGGGRRRGGLGRGLGHARRAARDQPCRASGAPAARPRARAAGPPHRPAPVRLWTRGWGWGRVGVGSPLCGSQPWLRRLGAARSTPRRVVPPHEPLPSTLPNRTAPAPACAHPCPPLRAGPPPRRCCWRFVPPTSRRRRCTRRWASSARGCGGGTTATERTRC